LRLTKDYPSSPLVKRVPNAFVVTARATAGGG
jgi:hypothetical protein